VLFRPIEHGADIVCYSLTKFIGGHGTSIGGAVVDSGKFDWSSGRFPEFTTPDPSYHGLVYHQALGKPRLHSQDARHFAARHGACLSPFNAFLFLQGLETLHVRMPRHCENALAVASFLEGHPCVGWVNYPGLESHPDHTQPKVPAGRPGGDPRLRHQGGARPGANSSTASSSASHLANIGDAKTLVIHPATTTHQQLPPRSRGRRCLPRLHPRLGRHRGRRRHHRRSRPSPEGQPALRDVQPSRHRLRRDAAP
jgi:O-acetylhomoserine (thiol)-lyase